MGRHGEYKDAVGFVNTRDVQQVKTIASHGKGFGLFNPLSQGKMPNITNLSNETAKNGIISKTRNTMNLKKLNENGLKNQNDI